MPDHPETAFICACCGQCCREPGYVYLKPGETERLAAFLDLDVGTFADRFTRLSPSRRGLSLVEQSDGACVFLDANGRCAVQAVKPEQCRDFPKVWRYRTMETVCKGWNHENR